MLIPLGRPQPQSIKTISSRSNGNHDINKGKGFYRIKSPNSKLTTLLLAAICLSLSAPTFAEQSDAIAISVGAFDISEDNDGESTEIGIEYRFAPRESAYNLIPTLGIASNADEAYWLYAGVRYDFHLNPKWILTPHWAISLYEKGSSTDLGSDIEFRTGLELAYKLNPNSHLGVGVYHLSNAGLDDRNPGSDSLILSYSFSPE